MNCFHYIVVSDDNKADNTQNKSINMKTNPFPKKDSAESIHGSGLIYFSDSLEQIEFSIRQCSFQEQLHEALKAVIERLSRP